MSPTQEAAMRMALEALEHAGQTGDWILAGPAITDLKEALAEPVQEPVAWLQIGLAPLHDGDVMARTTKPTKWNPEWWRFEPLYATPPQRPAEPTV